MARKCQSEQTAHRHAAFEQGLLTLLRTQTLQEISVKDICQAAGIPRRTFYHYFAGKEDLTDALIQDLLLACDLAVLPDFSTGRENMHRCLLAFFRFWQERHREDLALLLQNGLAPQIIRLALQWIQKEYLRLPDDSQGNSPRQMVAMATVTGFFALLFFWIQTGCDQPAEEMAEHSLRFLTRAAEPV